MESSNEVKQNEKKEEKEEKEEKEKEIISIEKNQNKNQIQTATNVIYTNLSQTEEINISFEITKPRKNNIMTSFQEFYKLKNIFRCNICKEILTTTINSTSDCTNIDYACPNCHFGSIDIILFISKFPSFSDFFCKKCAKIEKNAKNEIISKEIKNNEKNEKNYENIFFCKECQEVLCEKHIKECIINKEQYVSIIDLDFLCDKHSKEFISYCEECHKNLCQNCLIENKLHKGHKIYLFKEKLLDKEDDDKIGKFITHGNITKDRLKNEIEKTLNKFNNKISEELLIYQKIISQKIEEYEYLILYAKSIKDCYDYCYKINRFNHQIITNLYELFKKDDEHFIQKKFEEIFKFISAINKIMDNSINKEKLEIKTGIKLKDQKINNSTNNIKLIQEPKIKIQKVIFEEGDYTGEILDGLPHGKGIFKYRTGDLYEGEFRLGLREGNGLFKNKEGEYEGFWKKNKKNGHGKYIFNNGDIYMGEFKCDMFNGQGILLYSNGNKTIGTWENNKRNGIEYLFDNKGQIFMRVYENNTLIQEKKIDGVEFIQDFKKLTQEEIMEYMGNFYIKQLKKKYI